MNRTRTRRTCITPAHAPTGPAPRVDTYTDSDGHAHAYVVMAAGDDCAAAVRRAARLARAAVSVELAHVRTRFDYTLTYGQTITAWFDQVTA